MRCSLCVCVSSAALRAVDPSITRRTTLVLASTTFEGGSGLGEWSPSCPSSSSASWSAAFSSLVAFASLSAPLAETLSSRVILRGAAPCLPSPPPLPMVAIFSCLFLSAASPIESPAH